MCLLCEEIVQDFVVWMVVIGVLEGVESCRDDGYGR